MSFNSILFRSAEDAATANTTQIPDYFHDLNLDQVVQAITADWKDYNLDSFYFAPLHDLDAIHYRQDTMRDLHGKVLMEGIKSFSQHMRTMRERLAQADKLASYRYTSQRCFLEAVAVYCNAVRLLRECLASVSPTSRGLRELGEYLETYLSSSSFTSLAEEVTKLSRDLGAIRYSLLLRDGSVTVWQVPSDLDFSVAVEETFEKFRQGAPANYWLEMSKWQGMNHIEAQIQTRVALLYPETFERLQAFCTSRASYLDEALGRFDREIQFYVAYLTYLNKLGIKGLTFCLPEVSCTSKAVYATKTFDLALAGKLLGSKSPVILNDFFLDDPERVFVVSGPNQGGKTTFARTFGQLHHLACLGCPVPGEEARLFLFDQIFTHFEREEDITNLRGKLQDDLIRIRRILEKATPHSVIVMNEIFASTSLKDAIYLGKKVLQKISDLDALAVCVTFLDELASLDEKTVSVVSTIDPANPVVRTFKLERRPADGLAYALAIAQKHRVTYECLMERIKQ